MLPAVFDVTQVDVENGPYMLRATGKVMKSPGFLAVYREAPDEDAAARGRRRGRRGRAAHPAAAREGQTLELLELDKEQKFTQPPAQYSEATLVKALEENGIGRPSTYATILSTLADRDYAEKVEGRFRPTPLGKLVNGMLQQGFNDILNEGYTAALEEQLDEIEDGKLDWKQAVAEFDEKFTKDLETAGEQMPNVKREGVPIDEICPQCGSPLRHALRPLRRLHRLHATTRECNYTREPRGARRPRPAAAAGDGASAPPRRRSRPARSAAGRWR